MSLPSPLEFPASAWERFQNLGPIAKLLQRAEDLRQLSEWPRIEDWQARADALDIWSDIGERLLFTFEKKLGQRARRKTPKTAMRSYEQSIFEQGEIPTRAMNLHDFFNALVWLNFPRAKHALHYRAFEVQKAWQFEPRYAENKRSPLGDRLTCFDEGGVVFELSAGESRAEVEALFQSRDDILKDHFIRQNAERFTLFGHGIMEVMMKQVGGMGQGIHASCVILDPGPSSRDARLADYFQRFSASTAEHGSIVVEAL